MKKIWGVLYCEKKVLIVVIVALMLIGVISFFLIKHFEYSPKSFESLLGTNEANITKVLLGNADYGDVAETNDKEKIKEIINLINNRNYTKSNQEYITGCIYYCDFYSGDEFKVRVRLSGDGDNVKVNYTYYNVSKSISSALLTNWFDSLLVQNNK